MRRKQLYLDDSAELALKALAARTGRSEAALVREALDRYLAASTGTMEDPIEGLIGLVDDEDLPDDLAENHDHYLYGAPKRAS